MDQPSIPASAPPARPRRWRRRVLIALLVFCVAFGGWVLVLVLTGPSELRRMLAELDRVDPGWRIEGIEASRKQVPDSDNSALRIIAAAKLAGKPAINQLMEKMSKITPLTRLSRQEAAEIGKQLQACQPALTEARKLQNMPEGRWPVRHDVFSGFAPAPVSFVDALNVAKLLGLDALSSAHAGDAERALASCLAIQHTAQSLKNDPTMLNHLIRQAVTIIAAASLERTLAQCRLTAAADDLLRRLEVALTTELREQTFYQAMRGERAFVHQVFEMLAAGTMDAKKLRTLTGPLAFTELLETTMIEHVPGYLSSQHAIQLRLYTDILEVLKLPAHERDQQLESLAKKAADHGPILVRKSIPYLLGQFKEGRRSQAALRCALAAVAAERQRMARNEWPSSLEALVGKGSLDAVPTDPYNGQPLRFKRVADGLIVYSVGPDLVDNDGNLERTGAPGTDLGFRLWDVAVRP